MPIITQCSCELLLTACKSIVTIRTPRVAANLTHNEVKNMEKIRAAWAKLWSWPWKVKGPILGVAALIILMPLSALGSGGDEPSAASPDDETTTIINTPAATTTPAPPTDTPEPTPLPSMQEQLIKSYKDNKGFMPRASDDDMELLWVPEEGIVNIDLHPDLLSEGDALTVAGASAIVANRAFWTTYPDVQTIVVQVWTEFTSQTGQSSDQIAAGTTVTRATAERFDYDGLKSRATDNKNFFCVATEYQLHPAVYAALDDKGCLTQWGARKNQ